MNRADQPADASGAGQSKGGRSIRTWSLRFPTILGARCAGASAIAVLLACASSGVAEPAPAVVGQDGSAKLDMEVPYSDLASPELRRSFIARRASAAPDDSVRQSKNEPIDILKIRRDNDEHVNIPEVDALRRVFAVDMVTSTEVVENGLGLRV